MRVPDRYYDEVFEFAGQWEQPSACGLKIAQREGRTLVVVTELYQDNPGTSVTAAGGSLLAQICARKGFKPHEVMYLECTPDTDSVLSFYNEAYYEVRFTEQDGKLTQPAYRKLTNEEVEALHIR